MPSYPKWLYHPSKDAVVVTDEAAHKALGPGWYESPALFPAALPKVASPPPPAPPPGVVVTPLKKVK